MSFFDFDDSYSANGNKDSSFFADDLNDNRAGEKRTVNCFDIDGDGDDPSNSSEVQMKAPKMSKVDHIPSPVNMNIQEDNGTDPNNLDMNDNTKSVKKIGNRKEENRPLSDVMRDAIEEVRSKMLAMIPDVKRQEEASDSIMGRATVLEADINNYREQLAGVKHEYTSRLSQLSSILTMPR